MALALVATYSDIRLMPIYLLTVFQRAISQRKDWLDNRMQDSIWWGIRSALIVCIYCNIVIVCIYWEIRNRNMLSGHRIDVRGRIECFQMFIMKPIQPIFSLDTWVRCSKYVRWSKKTLKWPILFLFHSSWIISRDAWILTTKIDIINWKCLNYRW